MRSHGLPALFDPSGERTFLRSKGRWVSVSESGVKPGSNWYVSPGKEPLALMLPHLETAQPVFPSREIAVLSRDGRFVLAQAWHQARYLIANITDRSACTEPPPALGPVVSGETIRLRGKIYFFSGNLADLESKYR